MTAQSVVPSWFAAAWVCMFIVFGELPFQIEDSGQPGQL